MTPVDEWRLYRMVRNVIESGVLPADLAAGVSQGLAEHPPGRQLGTHEATTEHFLEIYRKRVLVSEVTGHEIANARGLVTALVSYRRKYVFTTSFSVAGRLVLVVYEDDQCSLLDVIVSTSSDEEWW